MKCRTFTGFRYDPDPPAVALDDPLDDRETDAVALLDLASDQLIWRAVVQLEDPGQLTALDADSVVANVVLDTVRRSSAPDLDARIRLVANVLARVAEEILEHVVHRLLLRFERRQITDDDVDALALYDSMRT